MMDLREQLKISSKWLRICSIQLTSLFMKYTKNQDLAPILILVDSKKWLLFTQITVFLIKTFKLFSVQ